MKCVVDACAVVALLRGEPGGDRMRDLLLDPATEARMQRSILAKSTTLRSGDIPPDRVFSDVDHSPTIPDWFSGTLIVKTHRTYRDCRYRVRKPARASGEFVVFDVATVFVVNKC